MIEVNINKEEDREILMADFASKFLSRYPNFNKELIKYKLLELRVINESLECPYYIESIPASNLIIIDPKRLGEASGESTIFLHQLMRILSGNINELNDGIIEQILSKLYPEENFYNFLDEKVVASLLESIFGEEELLNGLFDNKNLELLATQKLNYEGFITSLKEKMAANSEEIRYGNSGKPLSTLVDIIKFIFEAYINGNYVSITDLEAFKEIARDWYTEVMTDNEKFPEDNIYPGIEDIITYMDTKIEERRNQKL